MLEKIYSATSGRLFASHYNFLYLKSPMVIRPYSVHITMAYFSPIF